MKCPHCSENYFENWSYHSFLAVSGQSRGDNARLSTCPACARPIVEIFDSLVVKAGSYLRVYPQGLNRGLISCDVPVEIADDYREACSIATLSPKAAAALTRRCLQSILNDRGYTSPTLHGQIKRFISEKDPEKIAPLSIRRLVDGIRAFGNFGAHPISEVQTSSIIDVEDHEVDWSLTIIERLFDFFYVEPVADLKKKTELDEKLIAAGKPPSQ